jgi:hypothetical protein
MFITAMTLNSFVEPEISIAVLCHGSVMSVFIIILKFKSKFLEGARGIVVVRALCYEPKGLEFKTR